MARWTESWQVTGSTGNVYTVSRAADGNWGCSCPYWVNARAPKPECKHITRKQEELKQKTVLQRLAADGSSAFAAAATSASEPPDSVVRSTAEAIAKLEQFARGGRLTFAETKLLRGLKAKLARETESAYADMRTNTAVRSTEEKPRPKVRRLIRLGD